MAARGKREGREEWRRGGVEEGKEGIFGACARATVYIAKYDPL